MLIAMIMMVNMTLLMISVETFGDNGDNDNGADDVKPAASVSVARSEALPCSRRSSLSISSC